MEVSVDKGKCIFLSLSYFMSCILDGLWFVSASDIQHNKINILISKIVVSVLKCVV